MSLMHPLKVKAIRRETPDTVSVVFDVPEKLKDDFSYVSGQYLTLESSIDGESVRRSYSLCSAPIDNEWRVAIKKVLGGKYSSFANEVLKEGDTVDVMAPTGRFKLPTSPDHQNHYLGFAAGSGITPIISMIKSVLREEPMSHFTLIYGNKGFESIIFREELEALKNEYMDRFSLYHVFSREKLGSPLFLGRIDGEKCKLFAKSVFNLDSIDSYYLCGPSQMIFDVKDTLLDLGVPSEKVHFELFGTDDLPKTTKQESKQVFDPTESSKVTVILDGDRFNFLLPYGGDNVLDAAMKEGADLPFACKGGVCCTCKAKIEEGAVDMDLNYGLEPDEVEAGFVLTCQAHPRTPHIVVNFDEA